MQIHGTPPKSNMTMENHQCLVGTTSSNGWLSIVMLVLWRVILWKIPYKSALFGLII